MYGDRSNSIRAWTRVCFKQSLLDNSFFCAKNYECIIQILLVIKIFQIQYGTHTVTWLNIQKILNCATFGSFISFWNFIHLLPIYFSKLSEDQQIVVCLSYKQM